MSKLVNNACLWRKNWISIFWIPYFPVLPSQPYLCWCGRQRVDPNRPASESNHLFASLRNYKSINTRDETRWSVSSYCPRWICFLWIQLWFQQERMWVQQKGIEFSLKFLGALLAWTRATEQSLKVRVGRIRTGLRPCVLNPVGWKTTKPPLTL